MSNTKIENVYAIRRRGYDAGRPERAYLWDCADLSAQMKGYFKLLVENKEEVLLSLREKLYSSEVMDGFVNDYLFDCRPWFVFSSLYRRAIFTEFDALVLDTLTSTHSFSEEVDGQIDSSPSMAAAVVKAFLISVFVNDNDTGKPPIIWYIKSYVRYRIDKNIRTLTEDELRLRHIANVKEWSTEERCLMKGNENRFGSLFLSFMIDSCLTTVDREIVLSLERNLFDASYEEMAELHNRIKGYKEVGKWTIKNLEDRKVFIRRRLVAYIVLQSGSMVLSGDLIFLPDDPVLTPFIELTKLSSLGQAKLLSETDTSHLCPVVFSPKDQQDSLNDLKFYYSQNGVKTEIIQDKEEPYLNIWMSLGDDKTTESPATKIYPSGSFQDLNTGVWGNLKEVL